MPKQDKTDNHRAHRLHRESRLRSSAERRLQMRQLKDLRKQLFQRIHESRYKEQIELQKELHELESRIDALHGARRRRNPFERDQDFSRYYGRVRRYRFVFLFANLALWTLLFVLSGPANGVKILILFMALLTSASQIFELLFLLGVKNRILNPVESLKAGVAEIMKGNYTVVVDPNSRSEVSALIDAFNAMAHKLYEEEKLKEEYEQNRKLLIANISHDLKTPITSIQGYLEAIGADSVPSPEKLNRALTVIRSNTQYMNRLIDDLFLFSKLDMDKLEFHFAPVGIRGYMADMMEEFRLELEEHDARLTYRDELSADATVRIDAKRIHQVVRNIIGNARKYGPEQGLHIDARLYAAPGLACLDLTNNGPGIAPEHLAKIFDRFYRVDNARTKDTDSTGLGLAIARELVSAHGGQISVRSSDEAGTCFTIALPATEQGATE